MKVVVAASSRLKACCTETVPTSEAKCVHLGPLEATRERTTPDGLTRWGHFHMLEGGGVPVVEAK